MLLAGREVKQSLPVSMSREHVTVVACVSASGGCMPPLMIVKGKRERSLSAYNVAGGPPVALWTYQQKAWMEDVLGELWFKDVFLKHCGPERPQLLILDGHHSHEVIELLEAAREQQITILAMPPHASHWLQPLDKGCFGPLTKRFNVVCTEFMSAHYLNVVTKASFANLFSKAWGQSMTVKNVKKGFEVTGIFPLNPQVIPKHAYATFLASPANDTGVRMNLNGEVSVRDGVNESEQVRSRETERANENARVCKEVEEGDRKHEQASARVGESEEVSASEHVMGGVGENALVVDKEVSVNVEVSACVGDEVNEVNQIACVVGEVRECERAIATASTDASASVPVITDPDMVQALLSLLSGDPVDIATGCLDDIFSVGESGSASGNASANASANVGKTPKSEKGHRILTSEHVIRMKQEERERKEKRESMKAERERKKMKRK